LIDNSTCTDPLQISSEFNKFFSTTTTKISNNVESTDSLPEYYIPSPSENAPELSFDNIALSMFHILSNISKQKAFTLMV
jgi:hypothetical protein